MKRWIFPMNLNQNLCGLLVGVVCLLGLCDARPLKMRAESVESRVDVWVAGKFFTSYHIKSDEKYPFFYPINGPSGASVTSMRNGDYPHHSSLFFGCDQVNGGNFWQEGLERGQILSQGVRVEKAQGDEIEILDHCVWQRGGKTPLRDQRRIRIRAPSSSMRVIDFDITLEALEEVRIAKTNHALFSVRMAPDLAPANGGLMRNAEGASGEKQTFGATSPWMVCHGSRGKMREGLALFQHPSNPGYPVRWFTRDYGFFSPTPMFWPDDGEATHLARGEKLGLRYRVLVFSGEPDIGAAFQGYVAP
ncbi:MAG: PmoA family protein [Luteolibacter sp.]